MTRRSRTPRSPSIGFCSCSRRTASSSLRSFSVAWSPARATFTDMSVRSGRNSCSGGSISRMVTGSPSIASRISTKSPRCSGSSASSAACRPASSSARMRSSTSWRRSPRNMCSVRTRPTPPAPKRRARAQSSPVSALANTPRRRRSSACFMIRSTALTRSSASPVEAVLEVLHDRGRGHRYLAEVDVAAGAVDGQHVTLADDHAAGRGDLPGLGVHLELVGAADAGLAHAAGDDRGVAGLAAPAGQDALGGDHAVQVVRVGLAPDQDDGLARPRPARPPWPSRTPPCRPRRPGTR